jgi:hypothetical protein
VVSSRTDPTNCRRHQVAGDDAEQGGLAGAVRSDQRRLLPVADPEAHLVEELPAIREREAHPLYVDVSHRPSVADRVAQRDEVSLTVTYTASAAGIMQR